MIKRSAIAIGLLAAGATVNLTVAWGLAAWSPGFGTNGRWAGERRVDTGAPAPRAYLDGIVGPVLEVWTAAAPGATQVTMVCGESPRWSGPSTGGGNGTGVRLRVWEYHFGWPVRSMSHDIVGVVGGGIPERQAALNEIALRGRSNAGSYFPTWVPVGGGPRAMRIVPLRPEPAGMAAGALFYAGVLWAVGRVPGIVVRYRRRTRGLCVRCAYPIGVSTTCTECGAPVGHVRAIPAVVAGNGSP